MCGIAGIVSFQGEFAEADLRRMTDVMVHRGPDGDGFWLSEDGLVGLAHRRLSVMDLTDAAKQPFHSPCGNYIIIYNGEIYNYVELKAALEEQGEVFRTDLDTEVLLRLYMREKEACLDKLDGMWSFAVWDQQDQVLFCARDRFGEKPFHYGFHNNSFYFASEMKSLWAAGIPKIKNESMFASFHKDELVHNQNDLTETFYKGIVRLEHSHWMKVRLDGTHEIKRYYNLDWKKQDFEGTLEEAKAKFKELFLTSLHRRFRSNVKVGTSLSGGLDSSTIACNMAKFVGEGNISPLTFSARFEGFSKDEGYFINLVLNQTGLDAQFSWPTGKELFRDFEQLCYYQEEPFGSTSVYAQYRVHQLAKEKDITVLIDGQGADEILAGYMTNYRDYLRSLQKKNFIFSLKRKREQDKFLSFHTPHSQIKRTLIRWTMYYELRDKLAVIIKPKQYSLNEALYKEAMCGPLQDLLRYSDRNSMANSREVRLPYLNKELVEFCFSLPDSFKIHLGWSKFIMREAFKDSLPQEIAWRKEKVGFEPPQEEWLSGKNWKALMEEAYGSNLYELES